MTDQTTSNDTPLVCDMTAIDAAHREQHGITARELFAGVQDIQELPGGYAFHLPDTMLIKAVEFITNERLCCPFFQFSLDVEPNHGSIWLRLTGSAEVKRLIQVELGALLTPQLAHQMGIAK